MTEGERTCSVDDCIITGELGRRPSRPPDYEAENRALSDLADTLARSPNDVLQRLTDLMLELDLGDSAGISLAEGQGADRVFRWVALSGEWGHFKGGTMPFSASPCGVVMTRHEVMLFQHPERAFPDADIDPLIKEILLVPFAINGNSVGTVWANAHSDHRKFNGEDARLLKSLSRFASAAHQVVAALGDARVGEKESLAALEIELRARRKSEGRYRILFESIDEGFCTIEVIFDADNKPVDYRFLEINPAFERQTGLVDAEGKRMRELRPKHEEYWFEIYGRIALTGEPERFENEAAALGRWYDVYAFRVGEPDEHRVAILFRDISQRKEADARLRESERRLTTELSGSRLLQRLSTRLIPAQSPEALYDQILDTALELMRADAVSIQMLEGDGKRLRRVATRNLHPDSTEYWTWVDASHASTCGQALGKNERVLLDDVEASTELVGTGDLKAFRASGTRAVQSTPLLTREGRPIGMISTHWRAPRRLNGSDFGPFDIFARQVADLFERSETDAALRESEERQAFLLKLTDTLRPLTDAGAIEREATRLIGEHLKVDRSFISPVREDGLGMCVREEYLRNGASSVLGDYTFAQFGDFVGPELHAGRILAVEDVSALTNIDAAERASYEAVEIEAYLLVPVFRKGRLAAFFTLNHRTPRKWSDADKAIALQAADRTWTAIERTQAEEDVRDSEDRLATFFAYAPVGLSEIDGDGHFLRANDELCAMLECTPDQLMKLTIADVTDPDGLAASRDAVERVMRTGETETIEKHYIGCTGRRFAGSSRIARLSSRVREPRLLVVTVDLTERQRIEAELSKREQHQELLLAELQHRVRNTLAVVRSIARRTAENSNSPEDMLAHFQGRLDAFSRVQAALTRSAGATVSFTSLIEDELVAHAAREDGQVRIEGPEVLLQAKTAERLSLAIHELTTNAVKHGALANDKGRIVVRWKTEAGDGGERLALRWQESGVRLNGGPRREGFGMELLLRSLPYDLQAKTRVELRPHGLEFELDMPLPAAGATAS